MTKKKLKIGDEIEGSYRLQKLHTDWRVTAKMADHFFQRAIQYLEDTLRKDAEFWRLAFNEIGDRPKGSGISYDHHKNLLHITNLDTTHVKENLEIQELELRIKTLKKQLEDKE